MTGQDRCSTHVISSTVSNRSYLSAALLAKQPRLDETEARRRRDDVLNAFTGHPVGGTVIPPFYRMRRNALPLAAVVPHESQTRLEPILGTRVTVFGRCGWPS